MTDGGAPPRRSGMSERSRLWFAAGGAVIFGLGLVPPLSNLARRYEFMDALQFSIFALAVPALVVVGAPWRSLRLAPSTLGRLADRRRRHPELIQSFGFLGADLAVMLLWRTKVMVDAMPGRPWLAVVEAVSLVLAGMGLWLELVESKPLVPRAAPPWRATLATLAMWTIWTVAYVPAMSGTNLYRGFAHSAGTGLSAVADRQLSAGILWFVAAVVFMPVIFWNLWQWLRSEDDPDEELYRLVREERRRSTGAR